MVDRHTESRLKKDIVIWLVTTGKDLHPQAVPVWFVWDGESFLIHAQDGIKVRHVKQNPFVELHLNSDEAGDDLVRVSGWATLSKRPPAHENAAFQRKYGRAIKDLGMAPEAFSQQYRNVIRVTRLRYH
jgi:PPOX class probable F420-dependent enzyme